MQTVTGVEVTIGNCFPKVWGSPLASVQLQDYTPSFGSLTI